MEELLKELAELKSAIRRGKNYQTTKKAKSLSKAKM
jgi:hypothetical protein